MLNSEGVEQILLIKLQNTTIIEEDSSSLRIFMLARHQDAIHILPFPRLNEGKYDFSFAEP